MILALIKKNTKILVWKGDPIYRMKLTPKPRIISNDILEEHALYLMAGVGILAGKQVYDILKDEDIQLEWSDKHVSLEDQLKDGFEK